MIPKQLEVYLILFHLGELIGFLGFLGELIGFLGF